MKSQQKKQQQQQEPSQQPNQQNSSKLSKFSLSEQKDKSSNLKNQLGQQSRNNLKNYSVATHSSQAQLDIDKINNNKNEIALPQNLAKSRQYSTLNQSISDVQKKVDLKQVHQQKNSNFKQNNNKTSLKDDESSNLRDSTPLRINTNNNNLTAVQINQQQMQIEQQITQLADQNNADQVVRSEKIKVAVRGKQIRVSDVSHTVEATYERVFPKETTQSEAYTFVQDCIPSLLQGFNCTIFAYGQTGSGKTYTMFGEGFDSNGNGSKPQMSSLDELAKIRQQQLPNGNQSDTSFFISSIDNAINGVSNLKRGIIPRCIEELFTSIRKQTIKMTIYCSFLQIYNEKLYDLLQDTYTRNPLQIREDKLQGIYVEGLAEYVVQDELDCLNLLKRGERNRIKRQTKMNIKSSRSHTMFQLLLETDQVDSKGMLKRAKLNLGDLAGSEKINKDEEMKVKHMLELRNINLSLTTLGKVIQVLSQGSQNTHVPFRESKLTRLLQDSIGGNCQTYLVATVSPIMESIEETISTLKFADRAKSVIQRVKKNEINAKDDAMIQKLQKEVQYLKELLQMKRNGVNPNDLSLQLYKLKDENEKLKQLAINYEDIERMKQENKLMRLELQRLRLQASDGGSSYNQGGDGGSPGTPKSLANVGPIIMKPSLSANNQSHSIEPDIITNTKNQNSSGNNTINLLKQHQDASSNNNNGSELQRLSESNGDDEDDEDDDEAIQKQFKNYKTDIINNSNFEIKLKQQSQSQQQTNSNNIHLKGSISVGGGATQRESSDNNNNQQVKQLIAQKDKLYHVISEHHTNNKSYDSPNKNRHIFQVKKRYKEGDLSDDYHDANRNNITLPAILDAQPSVSPMKSSLQVKGDLTRRNSNIEHVKLNLQSQNGLHKGDSPYSVNRNGTGSHIANNNSNGVNYLVKSNDSYMTDFNKNPQLNSISKYPNRQEPTVRRSMHEFPKQNYQQKSDSYQLGSQGMVGMTTQSSLYGIQSYYNEAGMIAGVNNQYRNRSPLQTVVRIRGRQNQVTETKASILISQDEEKKILEKKRELKKSNDRLRMLENMERARQEKVELELEKLMADKHRKEQEDLRKREIIKQRKYVNANIGGLSTSLTISQDRFSHQHQPSLN